MMLKWAGRGHDPDGIGNTPPGGLTVECLACPHPHQDKQVCPQSILGFFECLKRQ